MSLFVKKNKFIIFTAASLILVVLIWEFAQTGDKALRKGFTPVNEQMQQLIDQTTEQASSGDLSISPSHSPAVALPSSIPSNSSPSSHNQSTKSSTHVSSTQKAAESSDKVDLNTATLEQLDSLPGIGESKAKAILAYRLEKGSFKKVEDLLEVKGIGEKMLAKIKSIVYVAPH